MKRNKLAAGALALALGLSAVAPSFAADTTSTKTEVKSTTLFQEKYAEELKKARALKETADAQKAAYDRAEVKLAEAKDNVLEAVKAYNAISSVGYDAGLREELNQARKLLAVLTEESAEEIEALEVTGAQAASNQTAKITYVKDWSGMDTDKIEKVEIIEAKPATKESTHPASELKLNILKDQEATVTEGKAVVNQNYNEDYTKAVRENQNTPNSAEYPEGSGDYPTSTKAKDGFGLYINGSSANADNPSGTDDVNKAKKTKSEFEEAKVSEKRQRDFNVAYARYVNAWKLWDESNYNNLSAKDRAYQAVLAAETAYDEAVSAYELAKPSYDSALAKYNAALVKLKAAAEAYNVVIVATNNGIEVKGEEEAPAKKDIDYVGLQAAIDRANDTLRAVELLEKLTPNTAANNRAKLNALVAEQKATIATAEAILAKADKKVALVATAYAAEEEVTAEDVDALIEKLDNNTDAIQKELKELDKDVEVVDEKPADDDKKDDDKKDDTADDKKDDTADDKKEDKADDKKVDTTKVVNKSANKTAGSNAKTGIAGVAGVAGVLAAASVAYAASKKNN